MLALTDALSIAGGLATIQVLIVLWLKSRLESSIKSHYDKILEDYRFDLKSKEQAAKAAEYIALARDLKPTSSDSDYRRANQLAWELALWLPDDIYRELGEALGSPVPGDNVLSVLVKIRKHLLKNPGTLTDNEIIHHAPNVGAIRSLGNLRKP
jgi:hypothetical protein